MLLELKFHYVSLFNFRAILQWEFSISSKRFYSRHLKAAEVVVVHLATAVDHHVAYVCHRSSHCPSPVPEVLAM